MLRKLIYAGLLVAACISTPVKAKPLNPVPDRKTPFSNYSNAIIIQWNTTAFEIMQGPAYNPLLASRIMAMVHIAMHDALNSIAPVYETYTFYRENRKADPIAAVSSAAYTVLLNSFPDKKEQLDIALAAALRNVKAGNAKERGLALGSESANAVLKLRADDHAFDNPVAGLNNPKQPGLYQLVPPMLYVAAPFWTTMKTFGISSPDQFRVRPMPSLSSKQYADAFNEVKQKGSKENSTRTPDETYIAKFWYEFSEIGWNRVTVTVAGNKNLDLAATARLFALVNMGLADSYTAGWDSKFHYNFWRPYTAIRAASTDNNENTGEDAAWEPLMTTPPVHDYPSTHSVLGSAAATILANILGDNTEFTMTSTSAEPVNSTRTFKSFSNAALENGDSRVFAGIHFRFSCDQGLYQGKEIGTWIVNHHLKVKLNNKGM